MFHPEECPGLVLALRSAAIRNLPFLQMRVLTLDIREPALLLRPAFLDF